MKFCASLSVLLVAGIFFTVSVPGSSAQADCICTAQFDPFCSPSGTRFGNACLLECARRQNPILRNVQFTRCGSTQTTTQRTNNQSNCFCTFQYDPLCSSSGRRFANSCLLECARRQNPSLRNVVFTRCRN